MKHPTTIPVDTCGGRGGDVMGLFVAWGDGGDNAKGDSGPLGVVGVVLVSDGEAGGVGGEIVCGEGLADGGFGGNEGVGIGGGGEVLCGGFKGWEGSDGGGGGGGEIVCGDGLADGGFGGKEGVGIGGGEVLCGGFKGWEGSGGGGGGCGEGGEVRGVCDWFVGAGEEAGGRDNDNGDVCGLAIVCKTGSDREEENMGCDLICLYVKGYYGCEHISFDQFKTMNSSYFKFRDICFSKKKKKKISRYILLLSRVDFEWDFYLSSTAMISKWISIILEFGYPKSILVSHYYWLLEN